MCAAVIDTGPATASSASRSCLVRGRTVVVADTAVHDMPSGEELADIAEEAASFAKRLGYEPRIAMLAYSTFGQPEGERSRHVREAVQILERRRVDFEFDGEMAADVALNPKAMAAYPFCRLSGPATVLGDAGVPLGFDLHQDDAGARRRHRHRPAAGRPRQAGADPVARSARQRHRQYGGARRLQCRRPSAAVISLQSRRYMLASAYQ